MNEPRHSRRDEEADLAQTLAPRRARPENSDNSESAILDLQSSAGNRAVAQLLESRNVDPTLAPLQRQPSGWRPKPKDDKTSDGTMTIPDMKLTMPIVSFSHQDRGAREAKDKSGVVDVTIALERADAGIYEASARGRQFDTIAIMLDSRQTVTLHSVVISSIQLGPSMAQLGLSFTSI